MKLVCCHYTILHFMPYISKYRALRILSKSYINSNYLIGGVRRNRTFATKNSPNCLANSSLNHLSTTPCWWEGREKVTDLQAICFSHLHTFPKKKLFRNNINAIYCCGHVLHLASAILIPSLNEISNISG